MIGFHMPILNCLHPQVASTALAAGQRFSTKTVKVYYSKVPRVTPIATVSRPADRSTSLEREVHARYLRLDIAYDVVTCRLYVPSVYSQTVEVYGSRKQVLQASLPQRKALVKAIRCGWLGLA